MDRINRCVSIDFTKTSKKITMSQKAHIEELLNHFGIQESNSIFISLKLFDVHSAVYRIFQ